MRLMLPLAAMLMAPTALLAQDRPPADAMPLSQILSTLEQDVGADLAFIDEVDWDDDGYYEVEYYTADGREVKVRLDPTTGQPR
ncbi:MAG: PepSY domain-containing protein [Paracoccus sp. (in: a-proteobacteria)]|uniref:PepSY domain-containing protein n=1 Tax=Paracoccus sp. TaxID=267 RepID=UPI00391DA928